ncbi:MAG TPA: hypothetical protein VJP79_04600 [Nitrososphaera sp.]|nr:hypothetical protein [Nitrososphaera sp.]
MFGKKATWKAEYEDSLYKIYDWDGNLAGYMFPHYGDISPREQEDEIIEELNRNHSQLSEATLLLPMVKLGLLDNKDGMDVDYVISSLETNASRTEGWRKWLDANSKSFGIFGARVHTAREDRNMLSIALGIKDSFTLGDKEIAGKLIPLLDRLHQDGLL